MSAPARAMETALPHRPVLDGVRALAVIAVLLFHGGISWARGGFLGVDVFFVLSGFLITSLMLVEYQRTGAVALGSFWWRRARRLLPALFAVIVFVSWYALTHAPELLRERLRGDLFSVLGYVANWRFIATETSYFERFVDPNPLLHTWSLAIEEQFYVLWPLLLLLILGPLRRSLGRHGRHALPVTLVVLTAASALLMAVLHARGASLSRVYYGTDTRVHALLVGAFASLLAVRRGWWSKGSGDSAPAWALPAAVVALGALVTTFVVAGEAAPWLYRGGFLAVALASAVLLVALVQPGSNPLQRLFTSRVAQWIGVRSYGIYLWHWPLYVLLTPARVHLTGWPLLVLRIGLTLVVAALSYAVIEQPVRRWRPGGRVRPRARHVFPALNGAIAALSVLVVVTTIPRPAESMAAPTPLPTPSPTQPSPTGSGDPSPSPSASARPLSVFIVGDSVAYGLHTENRQTAAELGVSAEGSTQLTCNTTIGGQIVFGGAPFPEPEICLKWPAAMAKVVAQQPRDVTIVMLGNGELFDHQVGSTRLAFRSTEYRSYVESWLDKTFAVLRPHSERLAIMTLPCYDRPDFGVNEAPQIVNDPARRAWLNDVIREYATSHPDVELFDIGTVECPSGRYQPVVNGVTLYRDGLHYTPEAARWAWTWLIERIRTPSPS